MQSLRLHYTSQKAIPVPNSTLVLVYSNFHPFRKNSLYESGCGQLKITSGGTANPPKIALPGAYVGSDPGITVCLLSILPCPDSDPLLG